MLHCCLNTASTTSWLIISTICLTNWAVSAEDNGSQTLLLDGEDGQVYLPLTEGKPPPTIIVNGVELKTTLSPAWNARKQNETNLNDVVNKEIEATKNEHKGTQGRSSRSSGPGEENDTIVGSGSTETRENHEDVQTATVTPIPMVMTEVESVTDRLKETTENLVLATLTSADAVGWTHDLDVEKQPETVESTSTTIKPKEMPNPQTAIETAQPPTTNQTEQQTLENRIEALPVQEQESGWEKSAKDASVNEFDLISKNQYEDQQDELDNPPIQADLTTSDYVKQEDSPVDKENTTWRADASFEQPDYPVYPPQPEQPGLMEMQPEQAVNKHPGPKEIMEQMVITEYNPNPTTGDVPTTSTSPNDDLIIPTIDDMNREMEESQEENVTELPSGVISNTVHDWAKEQQYENAQKPPGCASNEIYIVDGERTILLTNKKVVRDITDIQEVEDNLINQIRNQDRVITYMRRRLQVSDYQVDKTMKLLESQGQSFQDLLDKVNGTVAQWNSLKSQNLILEEQHQRDQQAMVNDRKTIDELRSHLVDKDRQIEDLKRQANGEVHEIIKSIKEDKARCVEDLQARDSMVDYLTTHEKTLHDKIKACEATCSKKSASCQYIKSQLEEQDNTILLLKDQIRSQASSMKALSQLLTKRHKSLENLNQQIDTQLSSQTQIKAELAQKDELITAQYQTIGLLKHINHDEDYLREAKEIALQILQRTVYSMVNDITYCKDEIIKGLHGRIDNLEKQQAPLELMVRKMRETINAFDRLEIMERGRRKKLNELTAVGKKSVALMSDQIKSIDDMKAVCSTKQHCQYDPAILKHMDTLYKPVNERTCEPICNKFTNLDVYQGGPGVQKCKYSPNVEGTTGLTKQVPPGEDKHNYEAFIGDNLTYVCQEGKVLDKGTGLKQLLLPCTETGNYALPTKWPLCT